MLCVKLFYLVTSQASENISLVYVLLQTQNKQCSGVRNHGHLWPWGQEAKDGSSSNTLWDNTSNKREQWLPFCILQHLFLNTLDKGNYEYSEMRDTSW